MGNLMANNNIYQHNIAEINTPIILKTDDFALGTANVESNLNLYFGEIRVLNKHPLLAEFFRHKNLVFMKINIKQNQQMSYSQEEVSLIMVTVSHGLVLSNNDKEQAIVAGDIILMPKDFNCEIKNNSDAELQFFLISRDVNEVILDDEESYQHLMSYNEERLDKLMQQPLVRFLQNPEQITKIQARKFLNCIQLFSITFQRMIFIRQATCNDPFFNKNFLEHFREEFGHDTLLENREDNQTVTDPVLTGILSWFPYQMFLADNVGKAALVHLVWEIIGDKFHALATPLAKYTNSNYFEIHEEHDESHAEMGFDLLRHQHAYIYKHLKTMLDESWDMFTAAFERVMFLINR